MKWPKVVFIGVDDDGDRAEIAISQVGERVCLAVGYSVILLDPSDANLLAEALGDYADDCNPQGENA
jgi:hypothetical protein